MSMTKERKQELIEAFKTGASDTGSPEVQVAICTEHIKNVTAHLSTHKKDFHSRRGLIHMVIRRRGLLDYLKRIDVARYEALIKRLELRR